ncbi:MAG: ABC transporter substrate-binding protein [Actinobacteria bacterium]|nr:ABC transporter substrate-binding protein [Actinomycetota bacterium]
MWEIPLTALAVAAVPEDGVARVIEDQDGIFEYGSVLLEYAQAAADHDLEDVEFLFEHPGRGHLRVRIESPVASPSTRELAVLPSAELFQLTPREIEVLTLIAGGLSNRDIGASLGARPKTVANHVARLLLKIDQSSRSGAAAFAVDHGLLCLPLPADGAQALLGLTVGLLHRSVTIEEPSNGVVSRRADLFRRRVLRESLKVGCILPAGAELDSTEGSEAGGRLAIAEINERGGVGGRRLEHVTVEADIWSHDAMAIALGKLADRGVDALVFDYTVDHTNIPSLLDRAASFGFPVLHSCASSLALDMVLDNPGQFGSLFQLCSVGRHYGDWFVDFITALRDSHRWRPGGRRLAVLDGYEGMPVFSEETANRAEDCGWEVSQVSRASVLHADAEEIIAVIEAVAPDVMLLPTFLDDSLLLRILEHIDREGANPLVCALCTPSFSGFIQQAGSLAEGLVWSTLFGRYPDRIGADFALSFQEAYGRSPGMMQAGFQYDAVSLLARAWGEVPHPRDFASVCRRIRQGAHRGVNGVYWFGSPGQGALSYPDDTHNPSIAQAHLVFQIQDGMHRVIAPSPFAETVFQAP